MRKECLLFFISLFMGINCAVGVHDQNPTDIQGQVPADVHDQNITDVQRQVPAWFKVQKRSLPKKGYGFGKNFENGETIDLSKPEHEAVNKQQNIARAKDYENAKLLDNLGWYASMALNRLIGRAERAFDTVGDYASSAKGKIEAKLRYVLSRLAKIRGTK